MKSDKDTQTIEQRVRECVLTCFYNPSLPDNFGLDTVLSKHGDSLDMVEFLVSAEEEFGIECDEHEEDFKKVKTYGEAVAFVEMCLRKKAEACK